MFYEVAVKKNVAKFCIACGIIFQESNIQTLKENKKEKRTGDGARLVECLPGVCKFLGSVP